MATNLRLDYEMASAQARVVEANADEINRIQVEIDGYNDQLASLESQQNKEVRENGFSEKYYKLDYQIEKIEDMVDDLEDKLDPEMSYLIVFYIFGGFIVFATLIISSSIYTTAKGREISAFFAQQQMPVGMESIDKMTPTVANSAEKIFRGIKKGLKDDEE